MSDTLKTIITLIREAINEDWIEDFEIDASSSFNNDLEIESIEFVAIAEKIQNHYGETINFIDWLNDLSLEQIIGLTVGQLAEFVDQRLA